MNNETVALPVTLSTDADALVRDLYEREGASLVRLARLFTDDRNAAEDLVQEAFIRLHRSAGRIRDASKAAPYLRSIVLNLARDHNRRGLVSLRHREALTPEQTAAAPEDAIVLTEDQDDFWEGTFLFSPGLLAVGIAAAAASFAYRTLPIWLGVFAVVVALGALAPWIGIVIFVLWVLATSIVEIIRALRPAVAADVR